MTKALMQAIHDLLADARKQGVDASGYVHYIEQVRFAEVQYHFEKAVRKHGKVQYTQPPTPAVTEEHV